LIVNEVLKNPQLSKNEMAQILNVSVATISRELKLLEEKGIIRREGSRKSGFWVVTRD